MALIKDREGQLPTPTCAFFNPVGTMTSFHLGMQVRDHSSRGWRRNRDAHAVRNDGGNDERECGWGKEEPLM